MDFFASQARAKHNTLTLSLLFGVAMLFLIAAIDVLLAVVMMNGSQSGQTASTANAASPAPYSFAAAFETFFLPVAAVTILVVAIAAVYKSTQVREGGPAIAAMLDASLLDPNTTDLDEKRLKDIVEEMAIAASIPPPAIYILYSEPNINAFAAGRTNSDAVIGVTYGCLKLLSRDELQGIVAHEFSHIVNGDTRLNIRMLSLVYGLLAIALIGQVMLRGSFFGRSSSRGNGGIYALAIGLALIILGSVGSFFGRIVRAAITRQRELLADAAAVQYTRNASGVAGALRKIGGSTDQSYLLHCNAEEANQFLFSDGVSSAWTAAAFLATHPRLADRIRLIDSSFDGTFVNPGSVEIDETTARIATDRETLREAPIDADNIMANTVFLAAAAADEERLTKSKSLGGDYSATAPPHAMPPDELMFPLHSSAVLNAAPSQATDPDLPPSVADRPEATLPTIRNDAAVRASFPPDMLTASADPVGAQALIFALILPRDSRAARESAMGVLAAKAGADVNAALSAVLPDVTRLRSESRLALTDLSISGLTQLSEPQYTNFRAVLGDEAHVLVHRDVSNYSIGKALCRYCDSYFGLSSRPTQQVDSMEAAAPSAVILISTLCAIVHGQGVLAGNSFEYSFTALGLPKGAGRMAPREDCTFNKIDQALAAIQAAAPSVKQTILRACARTLENSQSVGVPEFTMLRAIADALDLDVPEYVEDPYNPAGGALLSEPPASNNVA